MVLLDTLWLKKSPQVSPDGRWVAYQTTETLRWEVYIAAFPSFAEKRQVSSNGGQRPMWRQDGKELFYLESALVHGDIPGIDGKLMSVDVKPGAKLETGVPKVLFPIPGGVEPAWDQYCVTGDGKKFIFLAPAGETTKPLTVVLNWTAGLKR